MLRKGLLVCGIVSSLLYIATTIIGAMVWKGYTGRRSPSPQGGGRGRGPQ
jgi:hypothetical protein